MILKSVLYENEQNKIVDKVIDILQLDNNSSIILYDLDNDIVKQTQIRNLIPEIRKYYKCNCIVGVLYPEKVQRPWLSIIKHITKKKYKIDIKKYHIKKIQTIKYKFNKIN
jgi:hypothetical protein